MMDPGPTGRLAWRGGIVGGHQTVLDGVDLTAGVVRVKQSWGRQWGAHGFGFLTLDDLARMMKAGGEACVATEVPFGPVLPAVLAA